MSSSFRRALGVMGFALCLSGFFTLPFASASEPEDAPGGASSKERAKWRLAVQAAARQALDELESLAQSNAVIAPDLLERLSVFMLENPAACRAAAQAREACRTAVLDIKRAEFQTAVSNAANEAQEFSPLPVEAGTLLDKLGPGWAARVDSVIRLFLTNNFSALYDTARSRAVALQRQAVEGAIRFPAQEELEERFALLAETQPGTDPEPQPEALATLAPWLAGRFAPNASLLFEETAAHLGDIGGRMLEEIKAQYSMQVRLPEKLDAEGALAPELLTSTALASALEKALAAAVQEATASRSGLVGVSNIPVYGIFKPALEHARKAAQRIEAARVASFLQTAELLAPPTDELEHALRREPEAHREPAASLARLKDDWCGMLRPRVAALYVGKAAGKTVSEAEARELRSYFESALKDAPVIAKAFQDRVALEIANAMPPLRERLATEQLEKHFPALASAGPLPERVIEDALDRKRAQPRNVEQVSGFLEGSGLAAPAAEARKKLLAETDKLAVQAWNLKAKAAYKAFDAQAAMLRKLERDRSAALERDVEAGRPVAKIVAEWTHALEQAWSARPADESQDFPRIFAKTLDALDKAVRKLYDARLSKQQQQAATATTAPPSQGTPTTEIKAQPEEKTDEPLPPPEPVKTPQPEETPEPEATAPEPEQTPPKDARAVADVEIIFTDADGGFCSAAWNMREPAATGDVLFEPAEIEEAVTAILAAAQADIARMLESKMDATGSRKRMFLFFSKPAPPPDLRFAVSVRSRAVRHQMSILLRQEISKMADEWARNKGFEGANVSVSWKVGL